MPDFILSGPTGPRETPLEMVNAALSMIGEATLSSFEEGEVASSVALEIYEIRAREWLVSKRWRFCMEQAVLVRSAEIPLEKFSARYVKPSAALMVHSVSVRGTEIPFERYGRGILCNAQVDDVVIADYVFREAEAEWTPMFVASFVTRLASDFARSVQEQDNKADRLYQEAIAQRNTAASFEAQNRSPARLDVSAFIRARRR